jgi:FkbM family methyltransferase
MGAMDGVKYSNTKFFEDHLAWSGILIEPHPNNFYRLQHTRPFNKNFNALISDKEEDVEFIYTDSHHSSVSCVKETMPKDHDVNYFNTVDNKVIKMKPQRMDKIFKDAEIEHIDLFILDVEPHELNVLKTINFEEISIGVFMIENLENNSNDQECKKILEENGFVFKERLEINDIYVHEDYKF